MPSLPCASILIPAFLAWRVTVGEKAQHLLRGGAQSCEFLTTSVRGFCLSTLQDAGGRDLHPGPRIGAHAVPPQVHRRHRKPSTTLHSNMTRLTVLSQDDLERNHLCARVFASSLNLTQSRSSHLMGTSRFNPQPNDPTTDRRRMGAPSAWWTADAPDRSTTAPGHTRRTAACWSRSSQSTLECPLSTSITGSVSNLGLRTPKAADFSCQVIRVQLPGAPRLEWLDLQDEKCMCDTFIYHQ